ITKMKVGTRNCWRPVCPPGSNSTVAPVTKSGSFTVAENPPSEVTSPLALTPLGSGTFWSWASAGRLAGPTTSTLASAAIIALVIIGVLSRRRCELPAVDSSRRPDPPRRSVAHANAPRHGEASRGGSRMSRLTWPSGAVWWAVWLTLTGFISHPRPAVSAEVAPGFRVDVVVTGVPRPIQLAIDPRGRLVVLSAGWFGDAAGEVYRFDLRGRLPID